MGILKHMADHHEFWLTTATAPPPDCVQIHCGGLGEGALGGSDAPTFDCTHPRVDGACVCGPSLAPVDRLEAARLLPAHRRLPHVTFLNGLWWKLLAQHSRSVLLRASRICSYVAVASARLSCIVLQNFASKALALAAILLALRRLFPHADSLPSLEPWRCQKGCLPFCKLWHFRANAEYISFMQKRTYYVIGCRGTQSIQASFNDDLGTMPTRRPYSWKKDGPQEI